MNLNLIALQHAYPHVDRIDFSVLVEYLTGWNRAKQWAHMEDAWLPIQWEAMHVLLERRAQGEPIAYIIGQKEFYGRWFSVNSNVLIPRPETEQLIDLIKIGGRKLDRACTVWDVGTGSACIAVTLKLELPHWHILASDISAKALQVARENACVLNADIDFAQMDVLHACCPDAGFLDIIVSNPPYIAASDVHLQQGDLRYEPHGALTDGADGLSIYRKLFACKDLLKPQGGMMIVEHGYDQVDAVQDLMRLSGLIGVHSYQDLAEWSRITCGYRS